MRDMYEHEASNATLFTSVFELHIDDTSIRDKTGEQQDPARATGSAAWRQTVPTEADDARNPRGPDIMTEAREVMDRSSSPHGHIWFTIRRASLAMRTRTRVRGWRRAGRVAYFVVMTLLTAAVILFFIYGAVALAGA
jgi:hypothetical protein